MRALPALALLLALAACASPPPTQPTRPAEPAAPAHPTRPFEPAEAQPAPPDDPKHPPALPAPVSLPSAPGEAGVRAFVTEFMEARMRGDEPRARDFLSANALEQFGPGNLSLTGGAEGRSFDRWEIVSLKAADANSFEVTLRVHYPSGPAGPEGDVPFVETLFIGPGLDTSDTQRVWIVRGATES